MNDMQVFTNNMFGQVRVVQRDGEPWFVAADVCKALEISNPRMATERLDADEKNTVSLTDGNRGNPNMTIVNEPGLYTLVLGSRKPEAKLFKRWITHEVIPAIRKTGGYIAGQETLSDDELMARALLVAQNTIKLREERIKALENSNTALEAKVEADAPKVLFADSVAASSQSILIGELAKILRQNGIDIGQNRLFERLRKEGYLGTYGEYYNIPTQRAMDLKLFEIKKRAINSPDGRNIVSTTVKVTGKGQQYFVNRYLNKSSAP